MRNYYAEIRDAEGRRLFIGAGNVQCIDDMMESIVLNWWYFHADCSNSRIGLRQSKKTQGDIDI